MKKQYPIFLFATAFVSASVHAATIPAHSRNHLNEKLTAVKTEVLKLEQTLITSLHSNQEAKSNFKRVQALIGLQHQERDLGQARIAELQKTIGDLESRRGVLSERLTVEQLSVRRSLIELSRLSEELPVSPEALKTEGLELGRRKILKGRVGLGVKEIEALRVDLDDAEQLGGKIVEERQSLEAMTQEMQESEGILELNKQLQMDLIQRTHQQRLTQLENYRKLKLAEAQVSGLIQNFNARIELQESTRSERAASQAVYAMSSSAFAKAKGLLRLPILGKILARFGKAFDAKSRLNVFKKGVDIAAGQNQPVQAVFEGKVAFAGELPSFGKMLILDHGDHFYSICGNLGRIVRKAGEVVKQGEEIGASDESGTPVYFEIRARNIPVNPLQWIASSANL